MTLEMQLDRQIARNDAALAVNRSSRKPLDVAALRQAARRDYGPTARRMAAFEVAAVLMMALALWAVG